tara:strand:+ start:1905 stop:2219 length:315 start_codon:yes stop_codon:yes gene_type:complete
MKNQALLEKNITLTDKLTQANEKNKRQQARIDSMQETIKKQREEIEIMKMQIKGAEQAFRNVYKGEYMGDEDKIKQKKHSVFTMSLNQAKKWLDRLQAIRGVKK